MPQTNEQKGRGGTAALHALEREWRYLTAHGRSIRAFDRMPAANSRAARRARDLVIRRAALDAFNPDKHWPIFIVVCQRISEGESLRQICKTPGIPSMRTIIAWTLSDEKAHKHYAQARQIQYARWAEEIVTIADESERDWIEDEDGNRRPNNEVVQRSRLRVDTRKWLLSKLDRKSYGDEPASQVTINNQVVMDEPTRLRLIERLAELRAESGLEKPMKAIE